VSVCLSSNAIFSQVFYACLDCLCHFGLFFAGRRSPRLCSSATAWNLGHRTRWLWTPTSSISLSRIRFAFELDELLYCYFTDGFQRFHSCLAIWFVNQEAGKRVYACGVGHCPHLCFSTNYIPTCRWELLFNFFKLLLYINYLTYDYNL
jgi:hypothetical protein